MSLNVFGTQSLGLQTLKVQTLKSSSGGCEARRCEDGPAIRRLVTWDHPVPSELGSELRISYEL